MRPDLDPDGLSPDRQFAELARVLAAGLRRLPRTPAASLPPENQRDSVADGLEVPPESLLNVQRG